VLTLLQKGKHTVSELSSALGLTDNAVRAHITALERDGLVRASGTRRGRRKPTVTYDLTPEAEQLFPRAYGPVLRHVLDALQVAIPAPQIDEIMRAAGRDIARVLFPSGAPARQGPAADRAAAVLAELGGYCVGNDGNGRATIACSDCPLGVASEGHPEVCRLVETILTDVVAMPVRQHCHTDPPKCRFELDAAGEP
jgi:predicted ArsR family transcriptional regulator